MKPFALCAFLLLNKWSISDREKLCVYLMPLNHNLIKFIKKTFFFKKGKIKPVYRRQIGKWFVFLLLCCHQIVTGKHTHTRWRKILPLSLFYYFYYSVLAIEVIYSSINLIHHPIRSTCSMLCFVKWGKQNSLNLISLVFFLCILSLKIILACHLLISSPTRGQTGESSS